MEMAQSLSPNAEKYAKNEEIVTEDAHCFRSSVSHST
jgi:hypothetical protein